MKKPFKLKPTWNPGLHTYVQYRENVHAEWLDARVSQLTSNTITVFVFKYRVAHQINKFSMKEYIRKHPKDSVLNAWTGETGAFFDPKPVPDNRTAKPLVAGYNETTGEKVLNRIEQQEEDREFEKELFGGWTLVGVFVIAMLVCAFFWGLFFLGVLKVVK